MQIAITVIVFKGFIARVLQFLYYMQKISFLFSFTNCSTLETSMRRRTHSRNSLQGPKYLELMLKRSLRAEHPFILGALGNLCLKT